MKSTQKRIIIAAVIVVFVGAFMYWGTGFIYDIAWGRSSEEREVLIAEIESNKTILENRVEIDYSLEQQLRDAEYELDLQMEDLPHEVDIPEFVNEMLNLGEQNAVAIIPLRTTTWATASRSGYEVYRFQIQVTGSADGVTGFITDVESESSYVSSAVISGLQLNGESIGSTGQSSDVEGTLIVSVYRRS